MSANLYWEPKKRKRYDISESAPSSFMEMLESAFGKRCPTLTQEDVPVLRGMLAVSKRTSFQDLIDALDDHDVIEISAEY